MTVEPGEVPLGGVEGEKRVLLMWMLVVLAEH